MLRELQKKNVSSKNIKESQLELIILMLMVFSYFLATKLPYEIVERRGWDNGTKMKVNDIRKYDDDSNHCP